MLTIGMPCDTSPKTPTSPSGMSEGELPNSVTASPALTPAIMLVVPP